MPAAAQGLLNCVGRVGSVGVWVRGWCRSNFGEGGMSSSNFGVGRSFCVGGVGCVGPLHFGGFFAILCFTSITDSIFLYTKV